MTARQGARLVGWLGTIGGLGALVQELLARRYYARTPGPGPALVPEERTAWTAAWHEAFAPTEWLALRTSRGWHGHGVPRGDGSPVVLVHGFLTRGAYLAPLRAWLERMGYDAKVAPIGWNADCLDALAEQLCTAVERTRGATGRPVHLVGHSLGGVLARAAAVRARDAVASLATLGTPLRALHVHPLVRGAAALVRASVRRRRGAAVPATCFTYACPCATVHALAGALPRGMPQLAIRARHDGLVDWRDCTEPGAYVVDVSASHFGLVVNADAYTELARHLAAAARAGLAA